MLCHENRNPLPSHKVRQVVTKLLVTNNALSCAMFVISRLDLQISSEVHYGRNICKTYMTWHGPFKDV